MQEDQPLNSVRKKPARKKPKKKANSKEKIIKSYTDRVLTLLNENEEYRKLKPEQIAFAVWYAEPKEARGSFTDFAKQISVSRETLWHWRQKPVIMDLRFQLASMLVKEFTPDILWNIARIAAGRIPGTNPVAAAKLYLQYVEEWNENKPEAKQYPIVRFGFSDDCPFIDKEEALKHDKIR